MKRFKRFRSLVACLVLAWSLAAVGTADLAQADDNANGGRWIVGTWYLALDTEIFGLPPGLPLSGLAIFNRDGTYQFQDGGDFGQATFLDTRHSNQFGSWHNTLGGKVKGVALFLEADRASGAVLRWQKVETELHRSDDRSVVTGTATVSILECNNALPVPSPLTCPDPIDGADNFVILPPTDIPITLKRLRPDG